MSIRDYVKGLIEIFNDPSDPVKHCQVYKTVGCTHVDGMLCNMKTCKIAVLGVVRPSGFDEIGNYEQGDWQSPTTHRDTIPPAITPMQLHKLKPGEKP